MNRMIRRSCLTCGVLFEGGGTHCPRHRVDTAAAYRDPAYRAAAALAPAFTGHPCPACGLPMVGPHRPSVAHRTAVLDGGGNEPSNLRYEGLSCNLAAARKESQYPSRPRRRR